jgi:hypothetical protein
MGRLSPRPTHTRECGNHGCSRFVESATLRGVATYIVEHYLPGSSSAERAAAAERVRDAVDVLVELGVTHRETVIVDDDEMCMHVFDAADEAAVTAAHAQAGLPFDRVVEIQVRSSAPRRGGRTRRPTPP